MEEISRDKSVLPCQNENKLDGNGLPKDGSPSGTVPPAELDEGSVGISDWSTCG